MIDSLSASEKLIYSTIRIECKTSLGISTGSAFFFSFKQNANQYIPVLITNKHVVKNAIEGLLTFTKANSKNEPLDEEHFNVVVQNFESQWVKHPNPDVDLCFMPIGNLLNDLNQNGVKVFFIPLDMSLIPSKEMIEDCKAIEDIVMIGYPNGLWDAKNNKPIIRKGITASHPKFDYNGKKEIIIDAACFPGSSGSPVFVLYEGAFSNKKGGHFVGTKIFLLGTLYGGPQHTVTGEIKVVPINQLPVILSSIPNNLGLIIKSERIKELENLITL